MTDDAPIPTGTRALVIGCLVVAAVVIGIPAACTVLASRYDSGEGYDVSERTADVNDFTWPFTVDEGRILCRGAGQLVFESDRIRYALNDAAAEGGDYADLGPILRDSVETEGLKADIGGLVAYGNQVCGYSGAAERSRALLGRPDIFPGRTKRVPDGGLVPFV